MKTVFGLRSALEESSCFFPPRVMPQESHAQDIANLMIARTLPCAFALSANYLDCFEIPNERAVTNLFSCVRCTRFLECCIDLSVGTGVPTFLFLWNWSANFIVLVELECQLFCESGTGVPCPTGQATTINWSWLRLFCCWNWSAELECQTNVAVQFLYEYRYFLIFPFLCVSRGPRKAKITSRKKWQIEFRPHRRHCVAAPRLGWPGFYKRPHTYPMPHWLA